MTAFFIATATIKDAGLFSQYGAGAGPTIVAHGGELVIRGKTETVLSGDASHQVSAVARFPDMEKLTTWYRSPEYQALIPLRDSAADMDLVAYSQPS